ncbi:MAG: glutamyl-tRNA reductase [Actinobacteria bacterium]|nr:glutamyl-tRNA reductase [Actinomycetota bacterium]MBI3685985.1 glutamyl-tRNA reductase [Actinomycetota bacterium]
MTLLVVGLSHRTAPIPLLERAVVGTEELTKALHDLIGGEHVGAAMMLSTCNRVEVYADVDRFHGGVADVSAVLARQAGVEIAALADHLYVRYEDAAVEHLFAVAAGLDSMVLGEAQILGQLRTGYQLAVEADAVGRSLHEAIQWALRVGKRVRTDTGLDRAGASLVSVSLAEAEQAIGPLPGCSALVIGAGAMGALAATTLHRSGVGRVVVANRSPDGARRLAAAVDGTAAGLGDLPRLVAEADVVVACTGSTSVLLDQELVRGAVASRPDRPLVVLDLALPRDADASIADLPGVAYVDLAVLGERLNGSTRAGDVAAAQQIVATEVADYLAAQRAWQVAPTVAALRSRAAEVVDAELIRLNQRLPGLDLVVRAELARSVRRAVNTLLHTPTVRVKQLAGGPGGDVYAKALRELFGLDPAAPQSVATPSGLVAEELPYGPADAGGSGAGRDVEGDE